MSRLFAAVLATGLLVAACGGGGGDDTRTIATGITALETGGASFTLSETLTQTGGDIPKGSHSLVKFKASGTEKDDNAALVLQLSNYKNQVLGTYDLVINDSDLYVRPHGSQRAWYRGSAAVANHFYPGVRLNLLRETVLLASSVKGRGLGHTSAGFVHQYRVTPGADQLEQLQSTVLGPQNEAKFLKSASGSIDFSTSASGDHLEQVDVHIKGTDPETSLHQEFNSTLIFKTGAQVQPIRIPTEALSVPAAQLFSQGAGQ